MMLLTWTPFCNGVLKVNELSPSNAIAHLEKRKNVTLICEDDTQRIQNVNVVSVSRPQNDL